MKKVNKFASMLLVLAMLLSLSVTAFATGTATFNFVVTEDGESISFIDPITVTLSTGETVYSALEKYDAQLELDWKDVPEVDAGGKPTGVVCKVLNGMLGMETTPTTADNHPDIQVQFWSNSMPGYGLVSTSTNSEGETVYHYVYAGYAWMYRVTRNGQTVEPEVYLDQYVLQAGDVVTLDYCVQPTYWESTDYIFNGQ